MSAELSNKSLGLVRDLLRNMQPDELFSQHDLIQFWQDTLFDAGFSQEFIDFGKTFGFNWSHIIPSVANARSDRHPYSSKFGPSGSRELLELLASLVLNNYKDSQAEEELRESLAQDGFSLDSGSHADSTLPRELADLPGQKKLQTDLAKILSEQQNVALLFTDCDGFKAVNDTLGHPEGDRCLVQTVQTISAAILGKGRIYRYGGDEFAVILPNFDLEEAASTAERIRKEVERAKPGGNVEVTLSIGVANSQTENTKDANELIRAADAAMYVAKKTKNSVAISTGDSKG
jgi:diguanylate cyclase (GGDEF)-like protein